MASTHVIVVGNEKGGSGKSTTAMHLAIGFLRAGYRVAVLDLDVAQSTLSRFFENRSQFAKARGTSLPMPFIVETPIELPIEDADLWIDATLSGLSLDFVIIDTPGSASPLGQAAHGFADTIVTPLNDSFVDFDVLARVDSQTLKILEVSHYSTMVWEQKKRRAARDGGSIQWIVMRNRLSALDAISKRQMASLLSNLSKRVGFRTINGFGERVIFRDMFPKGLTILDLKETDPKGSALTLSQVAARQEVRTLIEAVRGQ